MLSNSTLILLGAAHWLTPLTLGRGVPGFSLFGVAVCSSSDLCIHVYVCLFLVSRNKKLYRAYLDVTCKYGSDF